METQSDWVFLNLYDYVFSPNDVSMVNLTRSNFPNS